MNWIRKSLTGNCDSLFDNCFLMCSLKTLYSRGGGRVMKQLVELWPDKKLSQLVKLILHGHNWFDWRSDSQKSTGFKPKPDPHPPKSHHKLQGQEVVGFDHRLDTICHVPFVWIKSMEAKKLWKINLWLLNVVQY